MRRAVIGAMIASSILFASCTGTTTTSPTDVEAGSGVNMTSSVPTNNVLGNPTSSIVLVEFSDFQCPACKSAEPSVKSLLSEFGSDIRFEYRHFPLSSLHKNAEMAAYAAESAGKQGKFFEMHNKLFENQAEWSDSPEPMQLFVNYASDIGLNAEQFEKDSFTKEVQDAVARDVALATELKVNSTPSFFLNGKRLKPASFSEFSSLVREAVRSQKN